MSRTYKTALSIAGFDGSGGAGIQADLKAFSALGCYGMTVLTALPAQNTQGVKSIFDISPQAVSDQLEAIVEDIEIDVIKIGMLHRPEIIEIVSNILKKLDYTLIVTDPVMVAKSGDSLLGSDSTESLKANIFPLSTIITPNLPEASVLLNRDITSLEQMEDAAQELMKYGSKAVVVKGGHLSSQVSKDCLYVDNKFYWFESERVPTHNTHGTGCTFSAAIAANLAHNKDIVKSVGKAKEYLTEAIKVGAEYKIGKGHGPVHHFYKVW